MSDELARDMARLMMAQAEKAALDEGLAKGELIAKDEARAWMKRKKDRFVARLLATPAKVAARFPPEEREEVRAFAQKAIEEYLIDIGSLLDYVPPELKEKDRG